MNRVFKDGAVAITQIDGQETALLTVRGKDHDFTAQELREFAQSLLSAAERIEYAQTKGT